MYASIKTENLKRFLYWVEERHRIHLRRLKLTEEDRKNGISMTPKVTRHIRKSTGVENIVADPKETGVENIVADPKETALPVEYLSQRGKPWTADPILQTNFFTNPFRENDRTTVWFRHHIRDPFAGINTTYGLSGKTYEVRTNNDPAAVIFATIAFRWFNYIPTGSLLLSSRSKDGLRIMDSLWESLFYEWNGEVARKVLFKRAGMFIRDNVVLNKLDTMHNDNRKVFTGAYIIKPPDNRCEAYVATNPPMNEDGTHNKIDAICWCIDQVWNDRENLNAFLMNEVNYETGPSPKWRAKTKAGKMSPTADRPDHEPELVKKPRSLESAWNFLTQYPYLGDFMAYEVVSDLRHTPVLENAPDIDKWAHLGPGAQRGLRRICGLELGSGLAIHNSLQICTDILEELQNHLYPLRNKLQPLPVPEMRDIEHSLCEFDKYERARLGEGQMKRLYQGGA